MLSNWEAAFKALGQKTRLKIVLLLAHREHCVCELERIIGVSQPAISQHMRSLKSLGWVEERRDGSWIYFSLRKEAILIGFRAFEEALAEPIKQVPEMAEEWARSQDEGCEPCS